MELAITMVISSFLYVGFLGFFVKMSKEDMENATNQKLAFIEESLRKYVQANGALPCPASRTLALTNASLGTATDCTAVSASGTADVTNGGVSVRIGAIPVTALGIDRSYIYDGWRNRFTYVVVKNLATTLTTFKSYAPSGTGPIVIQDKNANPINISSDVSYILISHGAKGYGAYDMNGVQLKACGSTVESQNCNDDYTFVDEHYFPTENSSYFDDVLRWKTRNMLTKSSGLAIAIQ